MMIPTKRGGFAVIGVGVAALLYSGAAFAKDKYDARATAMELSVRDTPAMNLPVWGGVAALFLGAALLLVPPKR